MSEKNDSCPCDPGAFHTPREVLQKIVADLRKIDMMGVHVDGVRVDVGAIADQIELAFAQVEESWRRRVADVMAVADQFKGALDHVLDKQKNDLKKRLVVTWLVES